MREGQFNLGGEQSGHIVMTDFATTGDGLVAALQILAAMVETGRTASDLARVFTPIPQILHNVRFRTGSEPLATDAVQQAIADGEKALGPSGRLLIRKSGTEPLIRVMGESEDQDKLHAVIDSIRQAVELAS
jgi:phosphoglucosamine mutase